MASKEKESVVERDRQPAHAHDLPMDTLRQRLSKLDACAVSDALDKLGMPGAVVGLSSLSVRGRICGRVRTTRLGPPRNEPSTTHLGVAAIANARAGDILVIEHTRIDVSGWGGLLSRAAKKKGVSGVIVDGGCRDVDEAIEFGLPVFARAAVPVTARGRVVEHSHGQPITVGGVTVSDNDLVIADGSGVVFVIASHATEILDEAEKIFAREAGMAKAIDSGASLAEVLGATYETMLERKDER